MYQTRFNEAIDGGKIQPCYVEMDPTERYGRFKDVLGKGAMKTVYRAFDEFLGMEVAWNQVKIHDALRSPEELQRLYSEVHLLKNLSHDSIMRFRASWIDVERRTFNFITEMFTSGTLREYIKRYKRVNIRAIKDWARQILEGLDYLHSHDPPVIHRDLKCDNIFVNGHLGQVKIGDLGLAAILRGSHHAHSVIGTPEFMAPELYEEDYDELVDIYSFGMCVLEMLTCEYPYSECSNPAQIYKKVTSGKLPEAFQRIDDVEAQRFVGRCLEKAPNRPSARELLMDPFLQIEEVKDWPSRRPHKSVPAPVVVASKPRTTDMTIMGTMNSEDDTIFLKVQISDKDGRTRNIFFPFDIAEDTPLDVATEMVKELDITDREPSEIADMISKEVSTLVPSWKDSNSSEMNQQYSFNYDDDEDDYSPHHPFYFTSSFSSSDASLPGLPSDDPGFPLGNLLNNCHQEESKVFDDASSQSSSYSENYANLIYSSANEDECTQCTRKKEPGCNLRSQKATRFCPNGIMTSNCYNIDPVDCQEQKMVRTRSMVDIRSQLLHRTLVEEITKRRMFKTVAAVEHIGFQDPTHFSGSEKMNAAFPTKSSSGSGLRWFKW